MAANIKLRHLRCFVAVAETGSFTLAANRLFQTQSSLTATIKQLEELVGLKLFDRTTRRVELTRDAIWFKSVAERVVHDFDNAIADLRAASKSRRGHSRIAVAPSMMTHVLVPALKLFCAEYPGISISIYDQGSDRVERSVLDGEVDFGLSSRLNDFPELNYVPVLADPFCVVLPPGHELATRPDELTWADLRGFPYVGLTEDTGIGALLARHTELGIDGDNGTHDYASSTTSLGALLRLGGNRISVLPTLAAHSGFFDGFIFRKLHAPMIERETCLITRALRSHSPSTQRILNALLTTIRDSGEGYGARALLPVTPPPG